MRNKENESSLVRATLDDYPILQKMGEFYEYEMSPYCSYAPGWIKSYFKEDDRHALLIKVGEEKAGFILINKIGSMPDVDWNMGEFFILAKFQGKSIGQQAVKQILDQFPGVWEVTVIPKNLKALYFWRKVITRHTDGTFSEDIKTVDYDPNNPKRIIFRFNAGNKLEELNHAVIRSATPTNISAIISLSDQKRKAYEKAQPQFWRRSKNANESQSKWFEELLVQSDHILLVAEVNHRIIGFIIGKLVHAPEVYYPGGLTLMIDDFCVETSSSWTTIGKQLLHELQKKAKQKGAIQTLVVCGHHDEPKRQFLRSERLSITSEWYVGNINEHR